MTNRISLKIVGASGQGIDSMGEVVAKSLKRSGYCVFGYREYPSLIKGGHASYQLDVSNEYIGSTETKVNLVLALNHHGIVNNLKDLKSGGILIHSTAGWKMDKASQELIVKESLKIICLPIEEILKKLKAKSILANVIQTSFVWAILGQSQEMLTDVVCARFAKKKDLLELNRKCIEEGFSLKQQHAELSIPMAKPDPKRWKDQLLITGSKAMGLGAVAAGMRVYIGYPMTPSSPLLTYIAAIQNKTGVAVKQAEDEITAAQMASGAMLAGTRAMTATSGGGFDLMGETVSLNALIENPAVFVLAQRPGPATGLPTWTAQADLLMAVGMAHGEFPRSVIAVSESSDAFHLMDDAFNIAEEYQIPVIVMTDKQIAEALYTQEPYDMKSIEIRRGKLVTDPDELAKLKSTDRYDPNAKDGISARWLPGSKAATFCSQGDEHNAEGSDNESSANAIAQMEKRMRKGDALLRSLPEPELWIVENGKRKMVTDDPDIDVLLIGWGSTKPVVLDVLKNQKPETRNQKLAYLHFSHLWPLKTARFETLAKKAKKIIAVEGNFQGQLAMLLRQQTSIEIKDKILKYDGRPFFVDELQLRIQSCIDDKKPVTRNQ
ncbi:MAG: 2-oxoacid:acceptor oxidoreductase subunit alpha [Candidatus Peribacteraceae bacterium]|nr:2-oxoacid:acceptor oxidoreductase subunit alpha [Candidatus Peribacteraceae bacterium]